MLLGPPYLCACRGTHPVDTRAHAPCPHTRTHAPLTHTHAHTHTQHSTVPHLADDEYVREAAELIQARLEPGLRVWVEHSNETWSGGGRQIRLTFGGDKLLLKTIEDSAKP